MRTKRVGFEPTVGRQQLMYVKVLSMVAKHEGRDDNSALTVLKSSF